jgi:hypothetical protein
MSIAWRSQIRGVSPLRVWTSTHESPSASLLCSVSPVVATLFVRPPQGLVSALPGRTNSGGRCPSSEWSFVSSIPRHPLAVYRPGPFWYYSDRSRSGKRAGKRSRARDPELYGGQKEADCWPATPGFASIESVDPSACLQSCRLWEDAVAPTFWVQSDTGTDISYWTTLGIVYFRWLTSFLPLSETALGLRTDQNNGLVLLLLLLPLHVCLSGLETWARPVRRRRRVSVRRLARPWRPSRTRVLPLPSHSHSPTLVLSPANTSQHRDPDDGPSAA